MNSLRALLLIPLAPVLLILLFADFCMTTDCSLTRSVLNAVLSP